MKKQTIHFDEAGNTGQDLLNDDQKVFVLSSVRFTENEKKELFKIFETDEELHFQKLKKSQKGREQILNFINHPLIQEKNILASACHKKFATVAHIVDQLIEPVMYDNGIDLYIDGRNLIYSNHIFYLSELVWDKIEFAKIMKLFIQMMRKKDNNSVDDFYKNLIEFSKLVDLQSKELFIDPIIESKKQIQQTLEIANKFTIDVTLSIFFQICNLWYQELNTKIDVIFDNSKQIEFHKEFIESMRNMNIEKQFVGYGEKTMIFPAQIDSLELKDSSTELSLQFADLIASTIAFMYNNQNSNQNDFVKKIQQSKLLNLSNYHVIWPYPNFSPKDIGMENSKGNNILDFLANYEMNKQ